VTQNIPVGNNIFSRISNLLSSWAVFQQCCQHYMMVLLLSKNWQNFGQFKGGNSGVPIYLVIYLGW